MHLHRFLIVGLAAILLSGCANPLGRMVAGSDSATVGRSILDNLSECPYRRYQGIISSGLGGNFSGSVDIICGSPPAVLAPAPAP